jgi:uncharacterized phage infection (PIP) family protein YhgE
MSLLPTSYRQAFLKSPHHAWLGILTLGLGFVSAQPLLLLAGAAAYVLGWIYLPDLGFFHRWVDRKTETAQQLVQQAEVNQFVQQRAKLLAELSTAGKSQYQELAAVCQQIENAKGDNALSSSEPAADPRLFKLDELMWTYLRLLTIQQSLDRFLAIEQREDLPRSIQEAEQEVARISSEIEALKAKGPSASLEGRQRLRDSRQELLDVLRKRQQRFEQAQASHNLVRSEQERLEQQIKLLRADAVAIRNTGTLTSRIDATVEHLDQTNRWLTELDEYRDLVGNFPQTEKRLGFGTETPPVISNAPAPPRPRESAKEKT